MKKILLLMIVCLVVPFSFALNVTDDIDLNQGDLFNFTQIKLTDTTRSLTSSPVFLRGVLNTVYGVDMSFTTSGTLNAPFGFTISNSRTSGNPIILAQEGTVKYTGNYNGIKTGYGARYNMGGGLGFGTFTTGTENYIGMYPKYNSQFLSGGSSSLTGLLFDNSGITSFSGNGKNNITAVKFLNSAITKLDNGYYSRYGLYADNLNSNSAFNESWLFYSSNADGTLGSGTLTAGNIKSLSWSNVSITQSQISDLTPFVYSDYFNQDLNTSDDVSFNSVTTDTILSTTNSDNYIEVYEGVDGGMSFFVDTVELLHLTLDQVLYNEDLVSGVNKTYDLGAVDNYWKDTYTYGENYLGDGKQGQTGNYSLGSCNMAFKSGIMYWTDCSTASPSANPTSPFPLGIPGEDDEIKSRKGLIII